MKKIVFFCLIVSCLSSHTFSNEKNTKSNKEFVYNNLLSRYNCIIGPNINNPEWVCNIDAPKGWAKFYGEKLKNIRKNRNRYAVK